MNLTAGYPAFLKSLSLGEL